MKRSVVHAVAIVAVLAAIAALTPQPGSTDRDFYQRLGRQLLVRDCTDIHCFRALVAGVLEHLPGPSDVKWKAYAVLANAVGALAVGRFCVLLGLTESAALAASWIAALGAGSLYSLFNCYTSDPLMYMLGPLMAVAVWQGRAGRAGLLGAIGVFAKEFAAAPLWIFSVVTVLERRWRAALRVILIAAAVSAIWLSMQAGLMALQNYRYGPTRSADWLHGAFFATWIQSVGLSGAATYLFLSFGALYLLVPVGLLMGGRDLTRLALATLPALAAFVYLEQPERALWNFHFIVIPIAAVALQDLPDWALTLFVGSFGVANLRFGAQLPIRGIGRVSLALSLVVAAAAIVIALRKRTPRRINAPAIALDGPMDATRAWSVGIGEAVALAFLGLVMLDVHAHRRDEKLFGVNQWGYRGPLETAPHTGVRVAMLGGAMVFGPASTWEETVPAQLADELNGRKHWTAPFAPFASVDNLAEPDAHADSYVATLRDYEYLRPDIVCVYDGYDAQAVDPPPTGRRTSPVFQRIGYLPAARAAWTAPAGPAGSVSAGVESVSAVAGEIDPSCAAASAPYCGAILATVRFALRARRPVIVATPPYVSAGHEVQQRSLAELLGREFKAEPRFRYVNLGRVEARSVVTRLADVILEVMAHTSREQGS